MYEQWSEPFSRGYGDALTEIDSVSAFAELGASIIFCGTVPTTYDESDVSQYKSGVEYVLGDDVQFMISRGSER